MSPSLQTGYGGLAREVKFLINQSVAAEIKKWAKTWLAPDPHGETYRVNSIYFDTEDFDVLRHHGSFGRSKYRVRRYGSADGVFLERKLKNSGRVGKKRTQIALEELPRIAVPRPDPQWPGYWYHRRLLVRRLFPVCQIAYTRTARIAATESGTIRLTMDDQIVATPLNAFTFQPDGGGMLVRPGGVILELKYREKPALFKQLIERFQLVPHGASKYRGACAALGLGVLQHA